MVNLWMKETRIDNGEKTTFSSGTEKTEQVHVKEWK